MEKLPISLVVITLNEEVNIERCLRSVPFASEIIIIDSGSQDKTTLIATQLGARVYQEAWRGFGPTKRRGVDLASQDWILSLDADEALSAELAQEIFQLFKTSQQDQHHGYRIPRLSFHLGKWIRFGGWYPDYQLRLFNKKYANWSDSPVHEKVNCSKVGVLSKNILHYVFRDLSHNVETNNRYSTLGMQALLEKKEKFSLAKLIFKPIGKFIECYLVKQGCRDGIPGFIIATGAAYSLFLKYAKLWERTK